MRIGDVSAKTGISVRSLRHYEELGLVTPLRSDADQRIYRDHDLIRLQQVVDLKLAGLPLTAIAKVMNGQQTSLSDVLRFHLRCLKERKQQLDRAVGLSEHVLAQLNNAQSVDLATLCDMIRTGGDAMTEAQWQKVYDKYYSDEEQRRWAEAKQAIGDTLIKQAEEAWPKLIERIQAMVDGGENPASDAAQAALDEWNALLQPIYEQDPGLLESAGKLYADMDDWPEGAPEAPFSQAVYDFIAKASFARNQGA